MHLFESDTQTLKLMKSFISSVDELEAKVNVFASLFDDLESKSFPQDVVQAIEDAQKFTKPASQIDSDDAESSDCLFTPQRQVAKRDAQRSVTSSDLPPAKRPRVPGLSHEGDDEQTAHKKLQPS